MPRGFGCLFSLVGGVVETQCEGHLELLRRACICELLRGRSLVGDGVRILTRGRAGQDQPADQIRGVESNHLRGVATHGKAQNIDLRNIQGARQSDGVVGPPRVGDGNLPATFAHPGIVELNDRTVLGQCVDQGWIPKIHGAAEVLEQQERDSGAKAQTTIGASDAIDCHILRLSCLLRRQDDLVTRFCFLLTRLKRMRIFIRPSSCLSVLFESAENSASTKLRLAVPRAVAFHCMQNSG